MNDPKHPNPNPSPPPAAKEPELQDQVDQLLDEVEALTRETLDGSEPGEAHAQADVATNDPAKETAADDVGLSSESPLVQDGERTSVEEVAADVDQELDQMERLISGIGSSTSPDDSGTSDQAEPPAEASAEAPDPQPPTDVENTTACDVDVIGNIGQEQAAAEPAVDAGSDPMPPASSVGPADASLEEDVAEIAASTIDPDSPSEPDALIAGQIPSVPQNLQPAESAKETTLNQDIDALLASSEGPDLGAPKADDSPPADLGQTPASTDRVTPKPGAASPSDIDLDSISIWRVVKLKLKAKSRHFGLFIGRAATDALVWLLDRIDAKIGNKLPPMAREMVGYCALATLAMSIIALIILLT